MRGNHLGQIRLVKQKLSNKPENLEKRQSVFFSLHTSIIFCLSQKLQDLHKAGGCFPLHCLVETYSPQHF